MNSFDGYKPTWCPGCGNFAIGAGLKQTLIDNKLKPEDLFIVFGIGCSGNMNDFINANAFHGLHGRALPVATAIKIVRPDKPVVAVVGDGDCYGEGGNHFLHSCRGNHDIKVIIHDNRVYGLTTGQAAPTADCGYISKSTPQGIIETPVNPLALAITQGATFVAQAFAGDLTHLTDILKQAMSHKGFSVVNVIQPCVTFNKVNTYQYYLSRIYKLDVKYDTSDYKEALMKSLEVEKEKFPLGVFYKREKPMFHEKLSYYQSGIKSLIAKSRFTESGQLLADFM